MVEINFTLIIQVINFFILLWVLNRFLYKPILNILEERRIKTKGTLDDAEKLEVDVHKMLMEYEKGLHEAKVKAQEERNCIRFEGVEREREIIEEARKNALKTIGNIKKKVSEESKKTLENLRKESHLLSSEIVKKILDREVG